jgi:hypothetical protein
MGIGSIDFAKRVATVDITDSIAVIFSKVYKDNIPDAKYKINDKVFYTNIDGVEMQGYITAVHYGDEFEYAVNNYEYLLWETDIRPATKECLYCGTTVDGSVEVCNHCGGNKF